MCISFKAMVEIDFHLFRISDSSKPKIKICIYSIDYVRFLQFVEMLLNFKKSIVIIKVIDKWKKLLSHRYYRL